MAQNKFSKFHNKFTKKTIAKKNQKKKKTIATGSNLGLWGMEAWYASNFFYEATPWYIISFSFFEKNLALGVLWGSILISRELNFFSCFKFVELFVNHVRYKH